MFAGRRVLGIFLGDMTMCCNQDLAKAVARTWWKARSDSVLAFVISRQVSDILRTGNDILVAGYCMYGAATELVISFKGRKHQVLGQWASDWSVQERYKGTDGWNRSNLARSQNTLEKGT